MVVRTLQAEIVRGMYPVGAQLPSEAQLVERFGVSRHTVREAIRGLREMDLVSSRQGYGSVVKSPGQQQGYVHQINEISDLFPANVDTRYHVGTGPLRELPPWALLSPELDAAAPWLYVAGTRYRDGETTPFNESDIYVAGRFAGVGRMIDAWQGPIYNAVETLYAEQIGEVSQTIGGFYASTGRGERIGLKHGEAGIEARRMFRLASDRSVAIISMNRYRIADFSFSMTLNKVRGGNG